MNALDTNLTDHRITGYAAAVRNQDDAWFDLPLFSHIEGNLWMGGVPVTRLPGEFRYVVNLYGFEPYAYDRNAVVVEAPMLDASEVPDPAKINALAATVNLFRAAGTTLVHCQAGLNRSGLVAAASLIHLGASAKEAIELLRARRSPLVLCNRTFEQWLRRLDTGQVREPS